jgi:hypothetical protein
MLQVAPQPDWLRHLHTPVCTPAAPPRPASSCLQCQRLQDFHHHQHNRGLPGGNLCGLPSDQVSAPLAPAGKAAPSCDWLAGSPGMPTPVAASPVCDLARLIIRSVRPLRPPAPPRCSILFVLLLAVPSLIGKAINAPVLLYAYGGKAVRSGGGAIRKGGGAMKRGGRAVAEAITGGADSGVLDTFASAKSTLPPAPSALSAMEEAVSAEDQAAAAAAEQDEQAAAAAGAAGAAASAEQQAAPHLGRQPSKQQVVPQTGGASSAAVVWLVWAFALYIAAVALLAVGTVSGLVCWHQCRYWWWSRRSARAAACPSAAARTQVEFCRLPGEPRCGRTYSYA